MRAPGGPAALASVPFGEALRFWLLLGFISFGGPAGQISTMHRELVERRRWISEGRFLHALQYCMVLPGPEAQQLATYVGWLLHGTVGGIVAGALFVLPSLLLFVGLSWSYLLFGDLPGVAGVLAGVRPAVVAVVLGAAWRVGRKTLRNPVLVALAVGAFLASFVGGVPFPWVVGAAGVSGLVGARVAPRFFVVGGGHSAARGSGVPAVLDDHTPLPVHARFRWSRFCTQVGAGAGLGLAAWIAIVASAPDGTFARMARFFTQAAFLTFGGAYAVLPYVYQGAVEDMGWLTGPQMMDGLVLGEATPGPLIMVVAWVGFLGGWQVPVTGWSLALSGAVGACVATFFTFLPSFVFILAGGPVVEASRDMPRFTAPLTGIAAAVVGVIVNLAAFFALHALVPGGTDGGLDGFAAIVGMVALVAVFRWDVGVVRLLLGAAVVGWIRSRLIG